MIRSSDSVAKAVILLRKALKDNDLAPLLEEKREHRFVFLNEGTVLGLANAYQVLASRGLKNVQLFMPTEIQDLNLTAYANAEVKCIACYFGDGKVAMFLHQSFYSDNGLVDVFTETEGLTAPSPIREKDIEGFLKTLTKIASFAEEIHASSFANAFMEAKEILNGLIDIRQEKYKSMYFEGMEEEFNRILLTCFVADVFGGMGSWNDSPAWEAADMGKEKEYGELSHALKDMLMKHMLYAINECFN